MFFAGQPNMVSISDKMLIPVLERIVASDNKDLFRKAVNLYISNRIEWIEEWIEINERILRKLNRLTADTKSDQDDDLAIFEDLIEEWKQAQELAGLRYKRLQEKYKKIASVERKQITKEEIDEHELKIREIVERANALGIEWGKKLVTNSPHDKTAMALKWLTNLTYEELENDFKRW